MRRPPNSRSTKRLSQLQERDFAARGSPGRKQSSTAQVHERTFHIIYARPIILWLTGSHVRGFKRMNSAAITAFVELRGILKNDGMIHTQVVHSNSLVFPASLMYASYWGDGWRLHRRVCTLQTLICSEQSMVSPSVFMVNIHCYVYVAALYQCNTQYTFESMHLNTLWKLWNPENSKTQMEDKESMHI